MLPWVLGKQPHGLRQPHAASTTARGFFAQIELITLDLRRLDLERNQAAVGARLGRLPQRYVEHTGLHHELVIRGDHCTPRDRIHASEWGHQLMLLSEIAQLCNYATVPQRFDELDELIRRIHSSHSFAALTASTCNDGHPFALLFVA